MIGGSSASEGTLNQPRASTASSAGELRGVWPTGGDRFGIRTAGVRHCL